MAYLSNGVYQTHAGVYHEGAFNLMHHEAPMGGFHPAPYPSMTPTLPVNRDDFRSEVEATFTDGELDFATNEARSTSPIRNLEKARSGLRSPIKLPTLQGSLGRDGGLNNYKVRFAGPGGGDGKPERNASEMSEEQRKEESSNANQQESFHFHGGSREMHQMAQLQILYNARGKRIDELTKELESVKDELSREMRMLKHELSLARGQWDGAKDSLVECRTLLTEAMASKSRADGQVAALQLQMTSLKSDNEELTKKIISAESTIESLNSQLSETRSTDNWTRAKQHYETTIATLKHKHETEILRTKQQLDDMTHHVETKNEEVTSLRKQLADVTKESELAQISRGESINRLARSLHDSQDQCNQLLQSGAGQELSRLKLQLQDALAGKGFIEDMNSAIQSELQELKEQVTMYESMSQFGLLSGPNATASGSRPGFSSPSVDPDDSYAQLGIKNPHPMRGDGDISSSTSEMLSGLKNELERCVNLYRDKRLQVAALQTELKATKSSLANITGKLESTTKSLQESEVKLQESSECRPGQGIAEKRLERELEKISKEKEELVKEVQELQIRLEEASISEQQATELCRDLGRQMSDLVKEHDEDKRQTEANQRLALERSQAAMVEHYERSKEVMRKEMVVESDEKMRKVRQDVKMLEEDLDETKRLYVEACEKRDEVEEEVNRKWQTVLQQQLNELRQQMISEKEELEHLRSTLTTDAVAMTTENAKWLEEQRKKVEMEMEAKLSTAEEDWRLSQKSKMEEAIRCAEEALRRQLEEAFDVQLKEELVKAVEKTRSDLRSKLQTEFEARIDHAKDEWKSTEMARWKMEELELELEKARGAWRSTEMEEWKAKQLEVELEKAREAWRSTELVEELRRARDDWMRTGQSKDTVLQAKTIAEARFKWERDELSSAVEKAKEEVRGQMEIHSAQVRAALEKDWSERLEAVGEEHQHQVAALQSKHQEELTEVLDTCERKWQQKMETALMELDFQAKAEKQEFLQLADEHNKSEISKLELTFQKRLTARLTEHEQRLSSVLQDNDNLHEQLSLIQMHAEQQEQQLTTDFEEAKHRWSNKVEEIRCELEKSERGRNELEKETENLRRMVEGLEEDKREALRKTEEDFEGVVANLRRQVEVLGDKLSRAERVFKGMEAKTQRRLSSLQDSLEREHAAALVQLEARLADQNREQDLAMETERRRNEEEVRVLKEELELEKRKNGDAQGLQATQVEALEEMRNYYLQAIAKVKEEVFRHLDQTGRQNAELLRQRLMRDRRRTARHLRKYYLRCFDQLLQRDFDSSFRSYALQSMQNLLDNMSDRDSSPNSIFSSASEFTTPRDTVAPPGVGPTSLQTTPASVSSRSAMPSVTTSQTVTGANLATTDVGNYGSPWSNASSTKFVKLPPGGVQSDERSQRLESSRVDVVTPTPDNQSSVGDACRQENLYFESPSRKSRDRLKSTVKVGEGRFLNREAVMSDSKAGKQNTEAHETLNHDPNAMNRNTGGQDGLNHDPKMLRQSRRSSEALNSDQKSFKQSKDIRLNEAPNSSSRKTVASPLTMEAAAMSSSVAGSRLVSEKSLSVSSLKPRSDAVFVTTRGAPITDSAQHPATVAMTTKSTASVHDAVGMATESHKTDVDSDDYVYTSLSQRLMAAANSQKIGQLSTLKSWSVSDLTGSTGYSSVPKTAAVSSSSHMAVSHGLMASSSSRPLAASSLSHIPSSSLSESQKTTKSPLSYANFSLSAASHKPAATASPSHNLPLATTIHKSPATSHMLFTTPPISHMSLSSHVAPASIQDHTIGGKVFNSRGEWKDFESGISTRVSDSGSRGQAANVASSSLGSNKQSVGRESRK